MPFNPAPSGYFPGINVGAVVSSVTGVFIPWSSLENFNSSTSGDIRQLVYAFNQGVYENYATLSSSGLSSQFRITRSQAFPSDSVFRRTFNTTINLAFSGDLTVAYESGV